MVLDTTPDLFDRARAGDRDALGELLELVRHRLEVKVHNELSPRLRQRVGSADMLQSVYLQVVTSVSSFRGGCYREFAAWVMRVLRHTIADQARSMLSRRRDPSQEEPVLDDLADPAPSPVSELISSEDLTRIARAMARLPRDYLRILRLHMEPSRTHGQTAELLGRSEGASRVLLARARARLAAELRRSR